MSASTGAILPGAAPGKAGWRISRQSVSIAGQHLDFRILLVAGADALLLLISYYLATITWAWSDPAWSRPLVSLESIWFSSCTMLCLVAVGMYKRRLDPRTLAIFARALVGFLFAATVIASLAFLTKVLDVGRGELVLAFLIALLLLGMSRALLLPLLGRERFSRRVLVYGCGARASELTDLRVRQDLRRFQVVGYVPTEGCRTAGCPNEQELKPRITPKGDLQEFVRANEIDEVIVAMDDRRRGLPVEQLLRCRLAGVPVTEVLSFIERESGKVELSMFYPSWLIFSEGIYQGGLARVATRVFDVVAAVVLLVLTLPFMVMSALAIWLEAGCRHSILYRQERVGLDGRRFLLCKLRSMVPDAEHNGPQWAIHNDPRVTRVGSFLRRTRLDELPQLVNVLYGEMSFVGPRPERPEFVDYLSSKIPYYRERHSVKPGITGWAQLCYHYGASEQDALEKLQYDLYYLKHKSFLFDLVILLQTVEVVLWRRGSR